MKQLRYPAVPLVTVDPHFSIWSCADNLCDDTTRHWTGRRHSMVGILSIDGERYRFMGKMNADNRYPMEYPCLPQMQVTVFPMHTEYVFENEQVRLTLNFMTPLLTDDLLLMSRPVSYISYDVVALDGKVHDFKLTFGMDCEIAINSPEQTVTAEIYEGGVRCGRGNQNVLAPSGNNGELETGGDDRNIDWGWLHLFSGDGFTPSVKTVPELMPEARRFTLCGGTVACGEEFSIQNRVVYICLEKEVTGTEFQGFVCTAYDDIHSIKYFGKAIDAYYKKDGDTFEDVCRKAVEEYGEINSRVEKTEQELMAKAMGISEKYADIISLAYRQAIAAHKLTWDGEEIQFLSKECFSNGCIGTLDVTYPSIPLFLITNPTLVEGMLNPLFRFAKSDNWKYDFAPHDVGQYPIAGGQIYGYDAEKGYLLEKQMPVEESGNAILCVYAICHYKDDISYFIKHRNILEQWVQYLITFGLDPENQLCTDDFAGHLAHNCNLSVKAIMGIAAFGKLLEKAGEDGKSYIAKAKEYAASWKEKAFDADHYKLAFEKENTWSLKYNMIWDEIFGWGIFDSDIRKTEIDYYMTQFNRYGLPLDSRSDYTKSDWLMWSVRLTDNAVYRNKIIGTMWDMLNESHSRVPFTDWYYTSTAKQVSFQNRTVQGGLFILMI